MDFRRREFRMPAKGEIGFLSLLSYHAGCEIHYDDVNETMNGHTETST